MTDLPRIEGAKTEETKLDRLRNLLRDFRDDFEVITISINEVVDTYRKDLDRIEADLNKEYWLSKNTTRPNEADV